MAVSERSIERVPSEASGDQALFAGPPWSQLSEVQLAAYQEAMISGICHEGAWEIAMRGVTGESDPDSPGGSDD